MDTHLPVHLPAANTHAGSLLGAGVRDVARDLASGVLSKRCVWRASLAEQVMPLPSP